MYLLFVNLGRTDKTISHIKSKRQKI